MTKSSPALEIVVTPEGGVARIIVEPPAALANRLVVAADYSFRHQRRRQERLRKRWFAWFAAGWCGCVFFLLVLA